MKSTERRFLVSSEMWLQQMQRWHQRLTQCDSLLCLHSRLHFDLFWRRVVEWGMTLCTHDHTQDNVCQQQRRCHHVRETNGGWFHGAVMLHVQSSNDYHMLGGGGLAVSFLRCGLWFALCMIQSPRWTMAITHCKVKIPLLKCNFIHDFFLYRPHLSHIYIHIATQIGRLKALHAG